MTNPTLEQVAAERRTPFRDCRSCAHFEAEEEDRAYGWCRAHDQFVKLYHPPGAWWSQCQFKALVKERATAT